MDEINEITRHIIKLAYRVHSESGPGLMEKVYESVLERGLRRAGLQVERQRPVSFEFDGMRFENAFCVDLLVEERVVVELKSVEKLAPVHHKQVLTYLRLLDLPVGILANFGVANMNGGLFRILNHRASGPLPILTPPRVPV
jgi:iron complex transport system substrate-binding protein